MKTTAGEYHLESSIPTDVYPSRGDAMTKRTAGDRLLALMERAAKDQQVFMEEMREQIERQSRQLGELIDRVGRLERCDEEQKPSSARRAKPVTDEEIQKNPNQKFWASTYTGNKPNGYEVLITAHKRNPTTLAWTYESKKVGDASGRPLSSRPAHDFYRRKEDADSAPRPTPSSDNNRSPSSSPGQGV